MNAEKMTDSEESCCLNIIDGLCCIKDCCGWDDKKTLLRQRFAERERREQISMAISAFKSYGNEEENGSLQDLLPKKCVTMSRERPCPDNYDPVCASDGETYANKCLFEIAECTAKLNDITLTEKNKGPCEEIPEEIPEASTDPISEFTSPIDIEIATEVPIDDDEGDKEDEFEEEDDEKDEEEEDDKEEDEEESEEEDF